MMPPPPTTGVHAGLDELVALRLRAGELASGVRRRAREPRAGTLHSPFRGRGMEYAESRPYSAGDDARHVDWRVTARSGQLHSKLFHAERERVSAVLFDAAPSMFFGTRQCFKSVQAARLAALFVWLAHADGDRIAGAVCGAQAADCAAVGGRRGVLQLLERLVRWQREAALELRRQAPRLEPLAVRLRRWQRVLRPGSHLLLTVDPRSVDEAAAAELQRLQVHHDVLACVLLDPLECQPPQAERLPVTDGRARGWLRFGARADSERWRAHFEELRRSTRERLHRAGVAACEVRTDEDPVLALRDLLRGRRHGAAP